MKSSLEYSRQYRKRHKLKLQQQAKEYYLTNREKILRRSHEYYYSHCNNPTFKQHRKEYSAEYHAKTYSERKEDMIQKNSEYQKRKKIDPSFMLKKRQRLRSWRHCKLDDKCYVCGSTKKLQFHHLNYDNSTSVLTLCKKCHLKIHYPDYVLIFRKVTETIPRDGRSKVTSGDKLSLMGTQSC